MTQKENVVARVAEMISSLGIRSIRMDDVAQSMGMSKRTLYEMFDDKEDLLFDALKYLLEQRPRELLKDVKDCNNSLELLFMCSSVLLSGGLLTDAGRRMAVNIKKFYPDIYDRVRRYHAEVAISQLQKVLECSCAEGYIEPTVDVELMVRLFFSIMSSAVYDNSIVIPDEISREEAYGALMVNFFRGISTPKGIEVIDEMLAREPRPLTLAERRAIKQKKEEK